MIRGTAGTKTSAAVLAKDQLEDLIGVLRGQGYQIVGPSLCDGAIVYDRISALADLPVGWTDHQNGGVYRLRRRGDMALFGYAVGPHSWKRFFHPERVRLWTARRGADGIGVIEEHDEAPKLALLGARSCELHAIAICSPSAPIGQTEAFA
jgi:hypothetical protein